MPTSYGGRLTLVKAVHAALPIFQMIALKYPEWLIPKIVNTSGKQLFCRGP
jgi:hypothetical protein